MSYKRYAFTRPLPEAAAVMEVIGRRPLDFYMPLHNSTFSGAYFYLSAEDAQLQDELTAVMAAAGLPPDRGEPEMPYLRALAPGIFRAFSLADDYEFYEAYGADPAVVLAFGTSSDAYAEAMWDCFTLVSEVPYFTSPRIADASPPGSRAARPSCAASRSRSSSRAGCTSATSAAASRLTAETPWQRTVHAYLAEVKDDLRAERAQAETEPEFAEEATVAQLFDQVYLRELDALARIGQFAGMVAAEAPAGRRAPRAARRGRRRRSARARSASRPPAASRRRPSARSSSARSRRCSARSWPRATAIVPRGRVPPRRGRRREPGGRERARSARRRGRGRTSRRRSSATTRPRSSPGASPRRSTSGSATSTSTTRRPAR